MSKEKKETIARYEKLLLGKKGEVLRGRELFQSKCADCHTLFGQGTNLGPDLTKVSRRDARVLLTSLIDPDSFVQKSYVAFDAERNDGSHVIGIQVESASTFFVLKTRKGQRVVLFRDKVKALTALTTSLMPDDLLNDLSQEELVDLFAYLQAVMPPQ